MLDHPYQFLEACPSPRADIENALRARVVQRSRKSIGNVTDIDVVTGHTAVTPDFYGLATECFAKEYPDCSLRSLDALPFAKRIGNAKNGRLDAVHPLIHEQI